MAKAKARAKKATGSKLAVVPPGEHSGQAVALVLPGETTVDNDLVNQAVQEVNRIHTVKGLEAALALGEYLLATFFAGDLAAFGKRGKKHASFRALADREDLAVAHTTLWYSVAVLDQLRQLPADIGSALPMSHHRLLLPVKDEKAKLALAQEAVDQKLGKREMEDRVRSVREQGKPNAGKAGRPVLPPWAKSVGGIERAVRAAVSTEIPLAEVKKHGTDKIQGRLAEVNAAIKLLTTFKNTLSEALTEATASHQ
jgi:hypothetical protein